MQSIHEVKPMYDERMLTAKKRAVSKFLSVDQSNIKMSDDFHFGMIVYEVVTDHGVQKVAVALEGAREDHLHNAIIITMHDKHLTDEMMRFFDFDAYREYIVATDQCGRFLATDQNEYTVTVDDTQFYLYWVDNFPYAQMA